MLATAGHHAVPRRIMLSGSQLQIDTGPVLPSVSHEAMNQRQADVLCLLSSDNFPNSEASLTCITALQMKGNLRACKAQRPPSTQRIFPSYLIDFIRGMEYQGKVSTQNWVRNWTLFRNERLSLFHGIPSNSN